MLRRIIIISLWLLFSQTESLLGAEQRARLELKVDQRRFAAINVLFRGDDILTRVVDLDATGITSAGGRIETVHGEQYISLKSLARHISFQLNPIDLVLHLHTKATAIGAAKPRPDESPPAPVSAPGERIVTGEQGSPARLAVHLNGVRKGDIAVVLRNQDILARLSDIVAIDPSLASGQRETIRGESYISLQSLSSQLSFSVDERSLALLLATRARPSESNFAAALEIKAPTPAVDVAEAPRSSGADQRAMLTIKVNQVKQGETDIILRGDDVLARVKDLKAIGMVAVHGQQEKIRGEDFVSLRSLQPTLVFGVNEKALALDLTITPDAFGDHVIAGASNRPAKIEYPEDKSGFVNYSLNVRDFKNVDVFSELGVTLKNTHLYSGLSRNADGRFLRGLSNLTVSNRHDANRFIVGDRLVNSDILGGSVTMGGVSYFRDFALDPYMVRNPGLHYSGAVSTPSTLDVYSNGQLVRRVPLPPGQFQVNDLPVPSGSNNTRFVIRDAFGRERELGSANFYFTAGLLTPGLHDFGYNVGTRRDDLGNKSWGYGTPLFVGNHRYGFSEFLTGGMRFEGSKGLASGGPGLSFLLPMGEMELAGAASTDQGHSGGAAFAGYNYVNQLFSLGASVKFQSQHYANSSLDALANRPWLETGSYVAFNMPGSMSVNLRYGFENSLSQGLLHRIRAFTSSYLTKQLRLFLDGYIDLKARDRGFGINAGVSVSFDEINAAVSFLNEYGKSNGLLDIRKSLPLGPGHGYGFQASTKGDLDSALQYQTSFGRYEAIYNRLDSRQRSSFNASGGIAVVDGEVTPTRAIQDGFALLRLPGLPGVRGFLNNLEVGSTDSKGNLFVPGLLSYYGNKLSFSRTNLPLSHNIEIVEKFVAPTYRGGVVVEFPVTRIQRVVGKTIIDKAGKMIVPKYGQLTAGLDGKSYESIVGNNGEFYFENIKVGRYQARIESEEQNCDFAFDVPLVDDETVQLGTLTCVAK